MSRELRAGTERFDKWAHLVGHIHSSRLIIYRSSTYARSWKPIDLKGRLSRHALRSVRVARRETAERRSTAPLNAGNFPVLRSFFERIRGVRVLPPRTDTHAFSICVRTCVIGYTSREDESRRPVATVAKDRQGVQSFISPIFRITDKSTVFL